MTRSQNWQVFVALACLFSFAGQASAQEPKLPGLLQRSPSPANTVTYLNIPALSKLMSAAEMKGTLAGGINEVWAIADLNTATLRPSWEAGYATLKAPVNGEALAAALGGYVDKVAGKEVVWTPRQSYLVPLEDNRLGFLRPANRTLAASWTDETGGQLPVSDFLAAQAKRSESFLSFLLAIDVENTFSPVPLMQRLKTFASLKGQDANAVAQMLSSAKGVSIIVGRRSLGECILAVDFQESPAALEAFAPALLAEILDSNGTAAPEVANWKVKVEGNTLSLQGSITEASLQGVLGILSLKDHADRVAASAGKPAETRSGESLIAYKTKEYFDDVNKLIDRVRKYEAQSTGYRAKWNDQNARRIEELGTLNVDPEMVGYGRDVASMLRGNATAIRKGNVAAGQIQAGPSYGYGGEGYGYGGYNGYYSGYGYQNAYSRARDQASVGARQRMGAFGSFKEALAAIDQLTADTRIKMTDKYQIQF